MTKYAYVNYIKDKQWFIVEKDETLYTYQDYIFKLPKGLVLKKGDYALVFTNNQFCVVKVKEICNKFKPYNKFSTDFELKTILSKLNFSCLFKEIEKSNRIKELEKQLDEMYQKVSKLQVLRSVAKDNKEMQELLNEYEKLGE